MYEQINDNQHAANKVSMSAPWFPPTPINNLFGQLKSYMKFISESREPITITATFRTGALVIKENGLFPISSKEWRAKPARQQTMTQFKTHFCQTNK